MRISDWSSDVCSSDLQARLEIGERLAEFAVAGLRQARYLVAQSGLDRETRGGTPGSGQEKFGAFFLDPHIVGGKRHLDAVFGQRDMAVEDVERALGTEVDRQQLAAAPQDAAQDRLAGGGIGGVDLVQPLLGREIGRATV